MKHNLENRPRHGREMCANCYAVDMWFEGFERELRFKLHRAKMDEILTEVETIKEILGEEVKP